MPKRTDLRTVLIVGSGPIRIGQGCEFDYAGAQACRVLRREGYRVVLVNSNPATIMTDPEWADATYLEPLDAETVAEVIERERPDALLPTLGGQTALNLTIELAEAGVLSRFGVELIGADADAIRRAEDRLAFRAAVTTAGVPVPESRVVSTADDLDGVSLPAVVRPAFTLGGTGGGIARDRVQLEALVHRGLAVSPIGQVLVERLLEGWQEHELEVMIDTAGNCVVVCSIENLDPMGVHTGDSWTVAPQQTLPDAEYQRLREAAFACARAVGVATGGANVQFAYEPASRELVVIEMNPRVSRSSALASKATGFPIAKIAALLAVGYTLDELPNDITGKTTAAFEPALDYVAVKAPRFDFAKFGITDPRLGTEMRAVGESLGLGRTFAEAFLKALDGREQVPVELDLSRRGEPVPERWDLLLESARSDLDLPGVHPYFADELRAIAAAERELATTGDIAEAKRFGLTDAIVARVLDVDEEEVRRRRARPGRLAVDSCAAEFEAKTPYFYLSYEDSDPVPVRSRPAIVILGSGPNRIGQGIEFDYCCSRAAGAFRRLGYETVLLNSNPETVSTDYDTSDRLYLEPLTLERTLDVCELEQPAGVVVQLGGQTPLALAPGVAEAGFPLLGDPLPAIERAEDRGRFGALVGELGLRAPAWGTAATSAVARAVAERIGYPVLVRPHHVLGGRGMRVVRRPEELELDEPALVDEFLEGALELDVDVLCDGESSWVGGILEHVEPAGVHSGDSACVIPAPSVTAALEAEIRELSAAIAAGLGARGLLNLQLALHRGQLYVLEANPRASRTVPFLAKATGTPLVDHACRLLLGATLEELDLPSRATPTRAWAKEAVFPEERFANAADRGPEMRSTGEVMASGDTVSQAYGRVLRASGRGRRGGSIGLPLQAGGGPVPVLRPRGVQAARSSSRSG
jgi:carbamoyl-phosphate synthase large subunit